ncbi:hypothetical protein BB560_003157 [Smittium megazygosporum]|uniref:U6 snRNA phosphodiesterase 1 n=1 Tax=Smittium megazygosporum TaxID=133381 RepID=A0A2T9ZCR8_9FUNG|nr:hypothetical protein BB560_003157 [Smittium megazygosporum]
MSRLVDYSDSEESLDGNECSVQLDLMQDKKSAFNNSKINKNEKEDVLDWNCLCIPKKVKGNWAVHVSIQVEISDSLLKFASECIKTSFEHFNTKKITCEIYELYDNRLIIVQDTLNSPFFSFDTGAVESDGFCDDGVSSLHISLTRPAFIKFHHIDSFVKKCKSLISNLSSFELLLGGVVCLVNENFSRSFIATKVLLRVVEILNSIMQEFGLPPFHSIPIFHCSFAWAHGDILFDKELEAKLSNEIQDDIMIDKVYVSSILLKIGNTDFDLHLK